MRPYLVSEMRQGEQVKVREPFRVRSVISPETARQTTELMVNALELGLKKATIPGYRMAGKSGTSGIPDQEGGYQGRDVIASFVGFGPVPNPRFVILVKYDKPKDGYWGGDVAAPEFREMAKFLLDYYGIAPTR
jgi:cell division protein FtsI/penicillin-binding protein 2